MKRASLLGAVIVGLVFGLAATVFADSMRSESRSVTSGAQTFTGVKTFSSEPVFSAGIQIPTAQSLKLNAGGTTLWVDNSGDARLDVATSKKMELRVNGTQQAYMDASLVKSVNGALEARNTTYGHIYLLQDDYGGAVAYDMKANPTDTAGNTAFTIRGNATGGTTALANADLLHFRAGGSANTTVGVVDKDGRIQINVAGAADGTCDSGARGKITVTQGGAGVADIVKVCAKGTADTYAWRNIYDAVP